MSRLYLPYHEREECDTDAMWRTVPASQREAFVALTAELMVCIPAFERACLGALDEWPKSCAVNLGNKSLNRRAWLGRAGTFLATRSPEDCTREGWHRLTLWQQGSANAAADRVIDEWARRVTQQITHGQIPLWSEDGPSA